MSPCFASSGLSLLLSLLLLQLNVVKWLDLLGIDWDVVENVHFLIKCFCFLHGLVLDVRGIGFGVQVPCLVEDTMVVVLVFMGGWSWLLKDAFQWVRDWAIILFLFLVILHLFLLLLLILTHFQITTLTIMLIVIIRWFRFRLHNNLFGLLLLLFGNFTIFHF